MFKIRLSEAFLSPIPRKMEVVYLFVCRFVCLFYFTNLFDTPWDSWDCVLRSQTTCSICSSFFEFLWASNSPIVRSIVENEGYEGLTFQCHAMKEDICGPYHVQSIRFKLTSGLRGKFRRQSR